MRNAPRQTHLTIDAFHELPGGVGAAVVDQKDFIGPAHSLQEPRPGGQDVRQGTCLIVNG